MERDMGRATVERDAATVSRWDQEADVVVVGFGAAGACAALGARERGADVLVLERASGGGGTSANSTGEISRRPKSMARSRPTSTTVASSRDTTSVS